MRKFSHFVAKCVKISSYQCVNFFLSFFSFFVLSSLSCNFIYIYMQITQQTKISTISSKKKSFSSSYSGSLSKKSCAYCTYQSYITTKMLSCCLPSNVLCEKNITKSRLKYYIYLSLS